MYLWVHFIGGWGCTQATSEELPKILLFLRHLGGSDFNGKRSLGRCQPRLDPQKKRKSLKQRSLHDFLLISTPSPQIHPNTKAQKGL